MTAYLITENELPQVLAPIIHQAVRDALKEANLYKNPDLATDASDYLTLKEAAQYLHISRPTFIALRRSGAFPAHPIKNRHLFRKSELDAYVQSQKA